MITFNRRVEIQQARLITYCCFLILLFSVLFFPAGAFAQEGGGDPAEVILTVSLAQELAEQALDDVMTPIGGMLGRIGPSAGFATGSHGFGYVSISFGATALKFEITDPDYSKSTNDAKPIEGPIGAFYSDLEIGLFSGFQSQKLRNMFAVDALIRYGATLGDQPDLSTKIDLGSFAPIFGVGIRLGVFSGPRLPTVSISAGVSDFTRRTFRVLSKKDEQPFEVALGLKQTTSFFVSEISKHWRWLVLDGGAGVVLSHLQADYRAEIVIDGVKIDDDIENAVSFRESRRLVFAGMELGGDRFRVVFEGGRSAGEPFGSLFFRFTPLLGRH